MADMICNYTFDDPANVALAAGMVCVYPLANQLFLDIDTDESFVRFNGSVQLLKNLVGVVDVVVAPSKSGLPRRHVTVNLPYDVTAIQRIALQAAMGSDGNRELLSVIELSAGVTSPTVFFEMPTAIEQEGR